MSCQMVRVVTIGGTNRRKQEPVSRADPRFKYGMPDSGQSLHSRAATPLPLAEPPYRLLHARPERGRTLPQNFVKTGVDKNGICGRHAANCSSPGESNLVPSHLFTN